MLDKKNFLSKHLITDSEFESSNLKWEQLEKIYNHFEKIKYKLKPIGNSFAEIISNLDKVSIVSTRVKDSERLIAKIIRYVFNQRISPDINETNYFQHINDLIGVRIICNYKSDWLDIHKEIMSNFRHKLVEKPIIYHLPDERKEYENLKNVSDFQLKIHELGYRSLNYTVYSDLLTHQYKVDIQLMTVFEAAWNSIFDNIVLRRDASIPIVNYFLKVLRDLSNTADNLASQISFIKDSSLHEWGKENNSYNFIFSAVNKVDTKNYNYLKIKELIAQNKIQAVVAILLELLKNDPDELNLVIGISSRYENIVTQIISGTINFGETNIEIQKINHALLELVDRIEARKKKQATNNRFSPSRS